MEAHYKTKAAVLISPGKIEILEYDMPKVGPKDLLLKVEMVGICGTDIHMVFSPKPFPEEEYVYPLILGHEIVGRIIETGSEAHTVDATGLQLKVGDRVTGIFGGGTPDATHPLLYGWCRGWATHRYVYGDYARIYRLPEELPIEVGVLLEPLSVGIKALERALEPTGPNVLRGMGPGKFVVVQGSGPIGLTIAILAKLCGAIKTVVVGAPGTRLQMCKEFGVDYTLNIDEVKSPEERISKIKELIPEGADIVFEAAGVPEAFAEGLEMVRRGGVYVEVGHFTERGTVHINPYTLCRKDINIYGSWGVGPYGFMLSRRIMEACYKTIPFEKIVTHRFSIEETAKAVETARSGKCMKAVLVPN